MLLPIARGAFALLLSVPAVCLAPAAPARAACADMGTYYTITSSKATRIPFKGMPTFKNGPGGTLSVTKDITGTASFQVTAGAEAEAGAVLAKAKVSVSASLTLSNSSSVTNNYSHKISSGKYGHAQYVSWGMTINWKKYYIDHACKTINKGSGTIKFPRSEEGWYYWETSS